MNKIRKSLMMWERKFLKKKNVWAKYMKMVAGKLN
jgi:hypothetical protein